MKITSPIPPPAAPQAPAPRRQGKGDPAALRHACQEFEALFINALLKGMRAGVPEGGLLEPGPGEEIYRDFLDVEVAKSAARQGGVGIAEVLYRQLGGDKKD